jgi:hypothetical protein
MRPIKGGDQLADLRGGWQGMACWRRERFAVERSIAEFERSGHWAPSVNDRLSLAVRGSRWIGQPNSSELGDVPTPSVLAEVELLRGLAPQRILRELLSALRAQVVPELLIDVVSHGIAAGLFHPLENLLHLLEMIAVVSAGIHFDGINRGIHLDLDDVTEILLGVDRSLT